MPTKHDNGQGDSKRGEEVQGGNIQGDREGRPYHTRNGDRPSSIVGAGLAPALCALRIAPALHVLALRRIFPALVCLCLLLFPLLGCDLLPSVTVNGTPVTSSANSSQLNVWNKVAPGVEVRYEDWKNPGGDHDTVTIMRFDLRQVKLSVGYQPAQPLFMHEWMQQKRAIAIINGGYFDQQDNATALVVSNGKVFGESYVGFGGMLSEDTHGKVSLRSLSQQPFDPNKEQLQQATQSSPMLMLAGKRTQFSANASQTRRSVVAMDRQGRLLFIASPGQVFSLDQLADQLAASDLSINVALNLDGGASTGLYANADSSHVAIDSLVKLPLVIIIKAK